MSSIHVHRLFDFGDIAGDWHVINHSIGPNGDISVLVTDLPNSQERRWDWDWEQRPESLPPPGGVYRVIHLHEGNIGGKIDVINLPPSKTPIRRVIPLGADHWLVFLTVEDREDPIPQGHAIGWIVNSSGVIIREFPVGQPFYAQADTKGRGWLGYEGSDQRLFGGFPWLEDADFRCLDVDGTPRFSFNEHVAKPEGIPPILFVDGINVVSDREVWLAYECRGQAPERDWIHVLARLVEDKVTNIWPSSVISHKAPTRARSFAVVGEYVLAQGRDVGIVQTHRRGPDQDSAHLYLVSMTTPRSLEQLPIDERGEWIGRFWSEGRGSRLYLETEHSLFVIDGATLLNLILPLRGNADG